MDKDAESITQDITAIVQTREAIAEKLGAIEQHVGTTMEHARTTMTQLADKTTLSMRETIQTTKEALDPYVHAARHPWVLVGGALVFGYAIGILYHRGWRVTTGIAPYYAAGAKRTGITPASDSRPSSERRESGVDLFVSDRETDNKRKNHGQAERLTVWGELEQTLKEELDVVRNDFIRFARGFLREIVRRAVPAFVQIVAGSSQRQDYNPHANSGARDHMSNASS
jgi:ElaB/YqjD/DUF883 family membrane-anchored ribosome-binding protein